ncbi:type II toxin-antitoxin system VapC family toxin [Dolichospermum compactum]|uniref:Virulence-associated protein VapC homolog n=1 Tax=Dolichospermum compactum NIES-806 TaxID=1973481 RepID=A0A1Z4V6G1_9CYAN|nr:hypothetical protein [Dolichospermum compactum]BAZ87122.1 virulence-associated protein VapC homolog [Dolichospermum compactum NIES-806]
MKYLLDTDHLSILQRQTGNDYSNLSTRMNCYPLSDFAVSTVTFHEQMLGCHAYINRARNSNDVVKGYEMMTRLLNDFKVLPLVSFDIGAEQPRHLINYNRNVFNWPRWMRELLQLPSFVDWFY